MHVRPLPYIALAHLNLGSTAFGRFADWSGKQGCSYDAPICSGAVAGLPVTLTLFVFEAGAYLLDPVAQAAGLAMAAGAFDTRAPTEDPTRVHVSVGPMMKPGLRGLMLTISTL